MKKENPVNNYSKNKKKEFLISLSLIILVIAATIVIIALRNTKLGILILDSLAIIGGGIQAVIGIVLFKNVNKFYLKILVLLLILIGLSMIFIHSFRIMPVNIWEKLGVR